MEVKTVEIKKAGATVYFKPREITAKKSMSVVDFIESVKSEFYKITWTTSDELRLYTKIIVATTVVFGLGIYGVDIFIQAVLSGFSTVFRWIFG